MLLWNIYCIIVRFHEISLLRGATRVRYVENNASKSSISLINVASDTNENIVAVSPLQSLPPSLKRKAWIFEIPFIAAYILQSLRYWYWHHVHYVVSCIDSNVFKFGKGVTFCQCSVFSKPFRIRCLPVQEQYIYNNKYLWMYHCGWGCPASWSAWSST